MEDVKAFWEGGEEAALNVAFSVGTVPGDRSSCWDAACHLASSTFLCCINRGWILMDLSFRC